MVIASRGMPIWRLIATCYILQLGCTVCRVPSKPVTLILYSTALSWNAASRVCEERQATLVTIENEAKNEAVQFLLDATDQVYIRDRRYFWIGLHNTDRSGTSYVWSDCTAYEMNELSRDPVGDGYCVALNKEKNDSLLARSCTESSPFICEEAKGTTCTFERIDRKAIDESKYSGPNVTYESNTCEEDCLSYGHNETECWMYASQGTWCILYLGSKFGEIHNEANRKHDDHTVLGRKVCFHLDNVQTVSTRDPPSLNEEPVSECWSPLTSSTDNLSTSKEAVSTNSSVTTRSLNLLTNRNVDVSNLTMGSTTTLANTIHLFSATEFYEANSKDPMEQIWRLGSTIIENKPTYNSHRTERNGLLQTTSNITELITSEKNLFDEMRSTSETEPENHRQTTISGPTKQVDIFGSSSQRTELSTKTSEEDNCQCPCDIIARDRIEFRMEELLNLIDIKKETLSSFKRKFTSASDWRPSSVACGILGITFLSMVFGGIALLDVIRCCNFQHTKCFET